MTAIVETQTLPALSKDFIESRRKEVQRLAEHGCTQKMIGYIIDIPALQVREHFRKELDIGRANLQKAIISAQLACGLHDRNPMMLKWLGKIFCGQVEPVQEIRHSGSVPMEIQIVDFATASWAKTA